MNVTSMLEDVSRETLNDLRRFGDLVRHWNPKINLVSKPSLEDLWDRHIVDSYQIWDLLPRKGNYLDLGSGGGFPGIPIAIAAKVDHPDATITLLESDRRKVAFLQTVIRNLGLSAVARPERIETADPIGADVITARALAPCRQLFAFCERHLAEAGVIFLHKGARARLELEDARKEWDFDLIVHQSKTDPNASILEVGDLRRV